MRCFPIIPIWLMIIICTLLIIYIIKTNKKDIIKIVIIILMFIINLRIMIPTKNAQILANNLDVLFVIDNTISMNAEDYKNSTRLEALKKDAKYIVNELNGSRFSIITFNNNAKIMIPYTNDSNITLESIDIIDTIEELYAKGSSLNVPYKTMLSSLKTSKEKENRLQIVFFMSDGEITDESKLESFKGISKYITNGAVLGYGTKKGGYMKYKNASSEDEEYIMDYSEDEYGKAVSKIDEKNLKKIAKDMNIDYIKMDKTNKVDSKLKEVKKSINSATLSSNKSSYNDIYYIFVIFLFALLLIEFNKYWRKNI